MEVAGISEIIASRSLHIIDEQGHKRPVRVFIGKPEPSADSRGYECRFQIIGIGTQETRVGFGRDSVQALKTTLVLVNASLNHLNDQLGGKLIWNSESKDA
jgi:hypothetical protein